jgi:hypothetical protein
LDCTYIYQIDSISAPLPAHYLHHYQHLSPTLSIG